MYIERKDKQYKSDRDCALVQYYKERGGGEGELSEAVLEELVVIMLLRERKELNYLYNTIIDQEENIFLETVTE
uniref:Uncharacterized protein n=1 Tax=Amphimedon queenslandica TaxID=400682 RepID=A0A1X7U4B3_AMPQE